jgi:hypothetical protein
VPGRGRDDRRSSTPLLAVASLWETVGEEEGEEATVTGAREARSRARARVGHVNGSAGAGVRRGQSGQTVRPTTRAAARGIGEACGWGPYGGERGRSGGTGEVVGPLVGRLARVSSFFLLSLSPKIINKYIFKYF